MFERLKKVIPLAIETKTPLLLWGERGVGKTEFVQQIIKSLGMETQLLRTAGKEDTDFSGIPVEIDNRTIYAAPYWMPFEEYKCLKCGKRFGEPYSEKTPCPDCNSKNVDHVRMVILFDEMNRGNDDVLQTLFEFVANRSFDGRKFASQTAIIGTANPSGGAGYIVNAFNDEAFLSRWSHQNCGVDGEYFIEWYNYLASKYPSETSQKVAAYIGEDREKLLKDVNSEWGFTVKPNPRSWDWALKIYDYGRKHRHPDEGIKDLMAGLIGLGITNEFFNIDIKVRASEVIKGWGKRSKQLMTTIKSLNRPQFAALIYSVSGEALSINKTSRSKENENKRDNVISFLEDVCSIKGGRDIVTAATHRLLSSEYTEASSRILSASQFRKVVKDMNMEGEELEPWSERIIKSEILNDFVKDLIEKD